MTCQGSPLSLWQQMSKETEWYRERCSEKASSLVCQWTPLGEPLVDVNNAQVLSCRKLDANDAQFFCVPCSFLSNLGVGYSVHHPIWFLYWCLFLSNFISLCLCVCPPHSLRQSTVLFVICERAQRQNAALTGSSSPSGSVIFQVGLI